MQPPPSRAELAADDAVVARKTAIILGLPGHGSAGGQASCRRTFPKICASLIQDRGTSFRTLPLGCGHIRSTLLWCCLMSYFDRATEALTPTENASLIDELISTIETGNGSERLRILHRVTDLFMAGSRRYSGPQIELFDSVLQQLSADIEVKARAKLAHRLAGMDNAPPKVIRSLAFSDEIEVAGPVLTHSMQLRDADLVENATTKSQDH